MGAPLEVRRREVRRRGLELPIEEGLTVEGAIEHLVDAAKGLVEDEIELAKIKVDTTIERVLRGGIALAAGSMLLLIAVVALAMAGHAALPDRLLPEVRLLIVAAVAAALGGALVYWGARRMAAPAGGRKEAPA